MSLDPGTKLGRYEIRSLIGAGGMGEVYLARDPKIGRDVAIKIYRGSAGRFVQNSALERWTQLEFLSLETKQ